MTKQTHRRRIRGFQRSRFDLIKGLQPSQRYSCSAQLPKSKPEYVCRPAADCQETVVPRSLVARCLRRVLAHVQGSEIGASTCLLWHSAHRFVHVLSLDPWCSVLPCIVISANLANPSSPRSTSQRSCHPGCCYSYCLRNPTSQGDVYSC